MFDSRLWFHTFQLEILRLLVTRFTLYWLGLISKSKRFVFRRLCLNLEVFKIDWKWPLAKFLVYSFANCEKNSTSIDKFSWCLAFPSRSSQSVRCPTFGAHHGRVTRKTTSSANTNASNRLRRRISLRPTRKPLKNIERSFKSEIKRRRRIQNCVPKQVNQHLQLMEVKNHYARAQVVRLIWLHVQ